VTWLYPVKVPKAEAFVYTVGNVTRVRPEHPAYDTYCAVCGQMIGGEPMTLVLVGVDPEEDRSGDLVAGSAIPVHAICTDVKGKTNENHEASPHPRHHDAAVDPAAYGCLQ
jgi:hypothetical protein